MNSFNRNYYTTKMQSIFARASALHSTYVKTYSNKTITGVATVIGAWCGFLRYDEISREESELAKKNELAKGTLTSNNISINRSKSGFDLAIIKNAPYSVNLFTTMMAGGCLGYVSAVYFPISIPVFAVYNYSKTPKIN